MIQLKIWQLKEFIKSANIIGDTSLLPINQYMRLSPDGTIVKANDSSHCLTKLDLVKKTSMFAEEVKGFTDDILIDKKTIESILANTKKEFLKIWVDDEAKQVWISDDVTHHHHGIEDIALYPDVYSFEGSNFVSIDTNIIKTLAIAKNFIADEGSNPITQCVHLKDDFVAAFASHTMYIRVFPEAKFPNIVFTEKQVTLLSQFEQIEFSESENHYCFKAMDSLVFVFVKTTYLTPEIEVRKRIKIMQSLTSVPEFRIQKNDICEFCESCNSKVPPKSIPIITMSVIGEDSAMFSMYDMESGKGAKRNISIKGEFEEFNFNSKITLKSFKALPQSEFIAKIASYNMVVFGKDNSYMTIAGMAKAQQG